MKKRTKSTATAAAAPLESAIVRAVLAYLERELPAAEVRKRHGSVYTHKGDPDIYFLLAGVHYECEIKRPGEQPTPLQQVRLARWRAAGARTLVAHSLAEFVAQLEARRALPV